MANTMENLFAKLPTKATPYPSEQQTIEVSVNPEAVMDKWSSAEYEEFKCLNSDLVEQLDLTLDEVIRYNRFLLEQRIDAVKGKCHLWHQLKALYITATIQTAMTMVGRVDLYNIGRILEPVIEKTSKMSIEEAYVISHKISCFRDYMVMANDAMPRGAEGDPHVMQMADIAGRIKASFTEEDDVASYIAAFLDLKLVEEEAWQAMYHTSYDTIGYITSLLTTDRTLLGVKEGANG